MDLNSLRRNYKKNEIDFKNLDDNPISFFLKWFEDAIKICKYEANACVLSTVSTDYLPSSRIVLLKSVNETGFTFFTNYKSEKSLDIEKNPNVALNFYWSDLERQVRITGLAKKIDLKLSDNYFKSRPRESQIGAWISNQSNSVSLDYNFFIEFNKFKRKFKGKEVERPINWGGYCIFPNKIEFWQGRPSRLHDRLLYKFDGKNWNIDRLAP